MIVAADFGDRIIAGAVMVVVLAMMFIGWRMRDRLRASVSGIVVGSHLGYTGDPVEPGAPDRGRPPQAPGHGHHSLEIDLDDDELLVFGRMDLGQDPSRRRRRVGADPDRRLTRAEVRRPEPLRGLSRPGGRRSSKHTQSPIVAFRTRIRPTSTARTATETPHPPAASRLLAGA